MGDISWDLAKKVGHFCLGMDDIFQNWFWILELVVYPHHLKKEICILSHIAKVTGPQYFQNKGNC